MKVLYVTPEIAPWVKTGGLGDVSGALPRALASLGLDVQVLVPGFAAFDSLPAEPVAHLPAADGWPEARLLRAAAGDGVTLVLLDCPPLYRRAGGPYLDAGGHDHPDNAWRFAFLSRVAALLGAAGSPLGWQPDIVHGHDWTCGLAPLYMRMARDAGRAAAASVITIHNLAFQGCFAMHEADALGIPPAWRGIDGVEFHGQLSMLKAGLQFSDAITTVSPTYAREIGTEAFGFGLQGVVQAQAHKLHGILNGIDTAVWNPAADPLLPAAYRPDDLAGKARCKEALQTALGLDVTAGAPLAGLVGRLTWQKGIDLVVDAIPWLLQQGVQLAVLGQGDPGLEGALQAAAAAHPRQVQIRTRFDEGLAHRIEAGSDFFLMPSRFEPCGLNQMYSQRYGTPPLVHATGGLADTVADLDSPSPTGIVIREATPDALRAGLQRALAAWRESPRWRAVQRNGMARDFGWNASARRYVALYASLVPALAGQVAG